jgi:threonine/homoserine efflux transporter RhtA
LRRYKHFIFQPTKDLIVNIQLSLAPIIALLAGILILVQPRLLNYIVAIYLIVIGLLGLFGTGAMRLN